MSNIVKSIFRQRELEKIYKIQIKKGSYFYVDGIPKYDEDLDMEYDEKNSKVISDKIIGIYDIEIPILEIGDEFFLHDIEETVIIQKRLRSSDGSVTYYVRDKYIDTENSLQSKEKCMNKIATYGLEKEKFDELNNKLSSIKKEFDDYKSKYKYKNRFFNRKVSRGWINIL